MSASPVLLDLLLLIATLLCTVLTTVQTLTSKHPCALFFEQNNFKGEKFPLYDESSISNFEDEYLSAKTFWNATGSFRVNSGCKLTACSKKYFTGACKSFAEELGSLPEKLTSLLSAKCSCAKVNLLSNFQINLI